MAGNLLYMLYSVLIIFAVIMISFTLAVRAGNRAAKNFLMAAVPVVMLIQFYYWNLDFNDWVKSYLFSSKEFICEYANELEEMPIPLPERTVLHGRDDFCSPFYITFTDFHDFKSFYAEKLEEMKRTGDIESYQLVERESEYWPFVRGYAVVLHSGSTIDILMKERKDSGKRMLSIDYEPVK
ncbi:MAG: hypothetical protein H0Z32_04825 [Bacillaceae bacterium]|nr:hypothetical protein [Bacillaceae bacterium]